MAATVGSISIDLSTNAAKFATGFKSAATTVEQQSARMSKSVAAVQSSVNLAGGTLKTFVGGLAAGAGLAALTSLGGAFDKLKETISQFDEVATNAKTVGLKSDTYQALAFAAKQANISQDNFNSSLSIFAKNAGLAEQGTGALFAGLKKLNPELLRNILSTTDQEERLKLVADALARTSDATQKAALSAVVFGKGGVEMSRILDQGRASIDKLKKAAQDLGIIIPDDLLQKAGELDDKLDALSTVISAQLGQALIHLAPLLVGATQGFADFSKELNATSDQLNNFVNNPSLANFAKLFGDGSIKTAIEGMAETTHRSTDAIQADIDEVRQKIEDLKVEAQAGFDVGLATDRAQEDLKALQQELLATQSVGVSAANAIRAFRASENTSMDALRQMQRQSGNGVNVLRYGAPVGSVVPGSTIQTNANNSGVAVRRFGGASITPAGDNFQADANESGVDVTRYTSETADNTDQTATNVDTLDHNTKTYLRSLSSDIGGYSAQQNVTINKLSDVTASSFGKLSSSILALLIHSNDSGATGSGKTMFGDAFDSQYGSYISSWGVGKVSRPTFKFPTTSSDGTYDTSVNVQQPGTNITLNYTAAKGESEGTARQNARAMYDELLREAARA